MEIKKLSKIEFSVEAQCSHGESDSNGGCHADCKKTKYVDSNAIFNWFWGDLMPNCTKKTVWTCSTLCCW
ncbi:MAG: hypothetical protein J6Z40_01950 [Oscillospiraceae bacterium]|nr:hypothetical protein [Oscillospiraceae bacterium]